MSLEKWFLTDPIKKAMNVEETVAQALKIAAPLLEPTLDRANFQVLPIEKHPEKPGLGSVEGHGRLLHDLANIELQAMELGMRTLVEFPDAPVRLREELAKITVDEARHFLLCCETLTDADMTFGDLPVHLTLWEAVAEDQDLLGRMMTVHRYLEGHGLDAGDSILKRLVGSPIKHIASQKVVQIIVSEEVEHVAFGSRWFNRLCEEQKLNPSLEFQRRYKVLSRRIPRREKPAFELRAKAGFSEEELIVMGYVKEEPVIPDAEPDSFGFLQLGDISV